MPEHETRAPARKCPPCREPSLCDHGEQCPNDECEPVSAWPFMLASGVGSLILVLIGYAIGWYLGGRR